MINIGILGCGRIGQVHGATLMGMPGARAVAVADAMPAAADALAAKLGAKAMTADALIARLVEEVPSDERLLEQLA